MIAAVFLVVLGIYLACGLLFAVPFAFFGAQQIDSHGAHGTWGFRLLLIPGASVFWPLLLQRWLRDVKTPPAERTAHRRLAQSNIINRP